MKILCVCLGNICRSPAAEAVLKKSLLNEGLKDCFVDSAGTSAYHQGEPADSRMGQALQERGYRSESLSRQVIEEDFSKFDYILAMDLDNLSQLQQSCPDSTYLKKIHLFGEISLGKKLEVPDPYYGGPEGFTTVIDLVEDMSKGFLETLNY